MSLYGIIFSLNLRSHGYRNKVTIHLRIGIGLKAKVDKGMNIMPYLDENKLDLLKAPEHQR